MLHLDFMQRVLFWIHNSVQHDAGQKKPNYMWVIWFLKQMIYLDCGHRHGLNSLDFFIFVPVWCYYITVFCQIPFN
jgi:hypothetical protein